MWAICMQEFKGLFKSIKSIFIISFLSGISVLFAHFGNSLGIDDMSLEASFTSGLSTLIVFLGMLFVFILSHDVISREFQSRTLRFLITKTSRKNIIIGKALGVTVFWLCCLFLSMLLIALVSKVFFFKTFIQCTVFMIYGISLTILTSTFVSKTSQSLIIGVILSLTLPILGLLSLLLENKLISWVKFLTPYHYMDLSLPYLIGVLILSSIFLFISIIHFERKDL
ncbi:ABC transporter permease subunit [Priestia aryabhattai]|uniref:ABC transporter permease n=1 Tax=Priestia TaxID=2800373 RepID=UPI0014553A2B|nr:ABC transporter permease subunit [Priestia aryabhattai]MBY0008143.1 ABC transporter permease subunit [Priestia aryabhattai]MBY0049946.1 ABC transporter permease subunit [Priestia aryabhattai]NLR46913.1 ABC transporter permease subunit [Priestia megaterium]